MNNSEKKMVTLLEELKASYHVTGIKAEFEAEGTRIQEAMRLKEVCSAAGLGLNIKIGGCEAIKDVLDCISLGAQRIIAPMVETPYALKKFLGALKTIYKEDIGSVDLLINIETITSVKNFDEMLAIPEINCLQGIVIGRVDMVGSLDMPRTAVNSNEILSICLELAEKAKRKNLDVVIGGGVSVDSIPFFQAIPDTNLDRFETRKVIFACPAAKSNPESAFLKAVEFELLWLKNKRDFYKSISIEDEDRIKMMEERYASGIEKLNSVSAGI